MNDLKGSKVLITGGAGFVGSFTAEQLIPEGVKEVIILDNLIRGSRNNIAGITGSGKARFIEGDIRDKDLVDGLLKGVDYCFHMAALRITHCAESPREAVEVMIDGTFNIAEACVKHKVRKIVAASSASIYGNADTFPTKEDHHPYNNRTLYGAAKMANELIFRSFCSMYGLAYDMLRYFNVYGPRMDIHGKYTEVLIRWYDMIRAGKEPLIYGDGKQTMDFVYVADVARSNILAMKADVKDEVFNIASGTETSLEDLCFLLLEVMNAKLRPRYIPISDDRRKVEVSRRLAHTGKAGEKIGFRSKVSLKEGLGALVAWLDEQRAEVRS
ncbi:MAG: NAD-dependent epimerase/dehydratase family protein [Candidatus Omnitrophica bacterium]|nr:NAD-dependent epimerase/dehydratase family protein [Candidatus Omnitrophota bacterium]